MKIIIEKLPLTETEFRALSAIPIRENFTDGLSDKTASKLAAHHAQGRVSELVIETGEGKPKAYLAIHEAGRGELVWFTQSERHVLEIAAHRKGITVQELISRAVIMYADGIINYQKPWSKCPAGGDDHEEFQIYLKAGGAATFKKALAETEVWRNDIKKAVLAETES